ncbi:MAG: hypothetical protein ACYC90_07045 [Candidatus Nanopelagicales bacterium]
MQHAPDLVLVGLGLPDIIGFAALGTANQPGHRDVPAPTTGGTLAWSKAPEQVLTEANRQPAPDTDD